MTRSLLSTLLSHGLHADGYVTVVFGLPSPASPSG
ncbi:zinc finger protein 793 isoform X3 [Prionailurus iriomotensis]